MNGKQLRASILQEAIAGRLVPQDPNDEPASELLRRIAPKATPIQDDVPFEIPDSWVWVKHNDILEISGGSQPPKSNFIDSPKEGYVRLYQIRDYGKTPAPVYVPKNMVSKFTKRGDILLARYGASIGKIFWAEDGAYNVAMAKVIPLYKPELISKKYLYLFYCAEIFQSCIRSHSRSAQAGFNKSDLNELLFPLPPLAEQKRIVAKIEELMPLVDEYEKAQEEFNNLNAGLKSKLCASLLQEAIAGRLVPQDPTDEPASELLKRIAPKATPIQDDVPFKIPDSWVWCRMKDICVFLSRGKSPKYSEKKKYPVFAQKCNLKDGWISLDNARFLDPATIGKWPDKYKLRTGDVLVNSTGTGTVCRTRRFDEKCLGPYPFVVPDSHVSVVRTHKDVSSYFILHYMSSQRTQQYLEDNLAGSTNQKELYIGVLENLPLPLPPLAEQKRIVAKLESMFAVLDKLDALTA